MGEAWPQVALRRNRSRKRKTRRLGSGAMRSRPCRSRRSRGRRRPRRPRRAPVLTLPDRRAMEGFLAAIGGRGNEAGERGDAGAPYHGNTQPGHGRWKGGRSLENADLLRQRQTADGFRTAAALRTRPRRAGGRPMKEVEPVADLGHRSLPLRSPVRPLLPCLLDFCSEAAIGLVADRCWEADATVRSPGPPGCRPSPTARCRQRDRASGRAAGSSPAARSWRAQRSSTGS